MEGVSRRQVLRETGMHWRTLEKILQHSEPPGYRQCKLRPKPKVGAYQERIEQILKEDEGMPRKQRHTAKRVWERLREEGYSGGYSILKDYIRLVRPVRKPAFLMLEFAAGECARSTGASTVRCRWVRPAAASLSF